MDFEIHHELLSRMPESQTSRLIITSLDGAWRDFVFGIGLISSAQNSSGRKAVSIAHLIDGYGGRRGPDLTYVGDKLSESDIVIRIVNGGVNMPAFGKSLSPDELAQITAFLQSRKYPMPVGLQARER